MSSEPPEEAEAPVLQSRALTKEEEFYLETAYKEPVESAKRLEEAAKFLASAVAGASGLFLAALKLTAQSEQGASPLWLLPLLLWLIALLCFVWVLVPRRYAVKQGVPESWKAAFTQAAEDKFRLLLWGTLCFSSGILVALSLLVFTR